MSTSERHSDRSADHRLFIALQRGDPDARADLVRNHAASMLALATRYLRDEAEACEVLHEAFRTAFGTLGSFDGHPSIRVWLDGIVLRSALAKLRSREPRFEAPIERLLPRFRADGHHAAPVARWRLRADSMEARESGEIRDGVRSCLDRLPDAYRTALLLTDIDGFSTREAAGLLGLSPAALSARRHRARLALRTLLDRSMREEAPDRPAASNPTAALDSRDSVAFGARSYRLAAAASPS